MSPEAPNNQRGTASVAFYPDSRFAAGLLLLSGLFRAPFVLAVWMFSQEQGLKKLVDSDPSIRTSSIDDPHRFTRQFGTSGSRKILRAAGSRLGEKKTLLLGV